MIFLHSIKGLNVNDKKFDYKLQKAFKKRNLIYTRKNFRRFQILDSLFQSVIPSIQ